LPADTTDRLTRSAWTACNSCHSSPAHQHHRSIPLTAFEKGVPASKSSTHFAGSCDDCWRQVFGQVNKRKCGPDVRTLQLAILIWCFIHMHECGRV